MIRSLDFGISARERDRRLLAVVRVVTLQEAGIDPPPRNDPGGADRGEIGRFYRVSYGMRLTTSPFPPDCPPPDGRSPKSITAVAWVSSGR